MAVLPDVLPDVQVKMINGTAKDALDYADSQGAGLKVIAIGGDKLARGLTLEGLCVSYFLRASRMYDTLMQMGRWFGYRPGYLDLCRLYTTPELLEWFGRCRGVATIPPPTSASIPNPPCHPPIGPGRRAALPRHPELKSSAGPVAERLPPIQRRRVRRRADPKQALP